ncbi:transmembrane protein 17B isoform X2 [Calliopsis andreniformis]
MALYINLWLFPVWLLITTVNLDIKYHNLTSVYKVIIVATFLIFSMLECLRLYLGYVGNLGGKIPELASFWLISILIQFPLEVFFLSDHGILLHYSDIIINSFMICLLFIEVIMGMHALKNLSDQRAKTFYMVQLYGIRNKS